MSAPGLPRTPRITGRAVRTGAAACLLLLALGCGRKGPPLPPPGRGPLPPTAVRVRQMGAEIRVGLTVSLSTRAGRPLRLPARAQILLLLSDRTEGSGTTWDGMKREREFLSRAAVAMSAPVSAGPGETGKVAVELVLTDEALGGANLERSALVLAARVVDRGGRRSDPSPRVSIAPLPPPPPPSNLALTPDEAGVALAWDPPAGDEVPAGFHVYRREEGDDWPERPLLVATGEESGARDESAGFGIRYVYGVRTAARAGRPYIESVTAEAPVMEYRDVYPPPVPEEVGVLETAEGLRVVWFPGRGATAERYRVQRAEADGPFVDRATVLPPASDWTDESTVPGRRYRYRVVAEDGLGNASLPSAQAEATRLPREEPP